MSRRITAAVILLLAAVSASAQLKPKVREIQRSPRTYLNELVEIDGFATQFLEDEATSTKFFFLKDDWGGLIRVRTSREFPEVGRRYKVTGVVGQDPRYRDLYIAEETRTSLDVASELAGGISPGPGAAGAATPEGTTPTATAPVGGAPPGTLEENAESVSEPWYDNRILLAVVLLALLLVVVVALVILATRRKAGRPRTSDFTIAAAVAAEPPPPPQQIIEGRTIKMHAPPPGTLKLLPGWLEVVAGDETVREIRFYRLKGEPSAVTTFGRASGRPYVHIQLKPMTVSSRQAQVSFEGPAAQLTNFASAESNPTRVNGRDLGVNEQVALSEGDKIEMGEVAFRYHAA